jgi:hypothetical protein
MGGLSCTTPASGPPPARDELQRQPFIPALGQERLSRGFRRQQVEHPRRRRDALLIPCAPLLADITNMNPRIA